MASVRLVRVRKVFHTPKGEVTAVDDVSLEVRDGEFLVLLGPSGCGKTTTLRMIAGLETPTSGEIYIGGRLVNNLHPKDRDVAMVFQNYALYPHMRVRDIIAFPLKIRKYPREEIDRRVREVAELLKIEHLLDRRPRELSGGEQQRVALGRAIVRRPQVFLMDEPLSNLDAKLRVVMRAELKRLQKSLGVTTIYVTHDQVEAMTMADRIAVMNKGRVVQLGTPRELFARPANTFVAGFIGSPPMNMIECSLDPGRGLLDCGVLKYPLDPNTGSLLQSRGVIEVILGIRPQHVRIQKGEVPDSVARVPVYVVEPMGTETIVNFKLGETMLKAVVPADVEVEAGEVWSIVFPRERVYIFDKKSGELVA